MQEPHEQCRRPGGNRSQSAATLRQGWASPSQGAHASWADKLLLMLPRGRPEHPMPGETDRQTEGFTTSTEKGEVGTLERPGAPVAPACRAAGSGTRRRSAP